MKIYNQCPYCNKTNCVNWKVFTNTENYGGSTFHVPCEFCDKMICVSTERVCNITAITKSNKSLSESDF